MGMLREGDSVIVARSSRDWDGYVPELDEYIGMVGEVIQTNYKYDCVRIDFNDSKYRWNFPVSALELVHADDLKPGDLSDLFNKGGKDD